MPECFTILADEIEGRIDPHFYRPVIKETKKILIKKYGKHFLGEVIKEIYRYPTFYGIKYLKEGIRVIKGESISKEGIISKDIEFDYIDEKTHNKFKRTHIKKNNLIFTVRGVVGKVGYYEFDDEANINANVIKIKFKEKQNPKFFWIYLNSERGQILIDSLTSGQVQKTITVPDIKNILIPLPPLQTQNHIVALMDNAYNLKKQKETEAQQLLDSINDYVLDELGIKLPELKDKMAYVVYADDVKGKRIDAYYYQPKFEEVEEAIEKGKFEVKEIGKVLAISDKLENIKNYDFINYIDLASINKDLGIIKSYNKLEIKDAPSRARQKIEKGDLLLSSLSGSLKSIAIFEGNFNNAICSTGFYVIKNSNNYNNYYLWALFKTDILQIHLQRKCSGAIMSAINRQALSKIKIPLPPLSIQNKIAEEVKKRMKKAEQLQKEAKEELEKAKQEVERIIFN